MTYKKTRRMSLCPNCRTIQVHGTACTNCKCPVSVPPEKKKQYPVVEATNPFPNKEK